METKAKQYIMWYSADLASFLFNCALKNAFFGDRAEILLLCAEKLPFLGSVQKYYYPGTRCPWSLVQGHFWGSCRNINFWRNIHLWYDPQVETWWAAEELPKLWLEGENCFHFNWINLYLTAMYTEANQKCSFLTLFKHLLTLPFFPHSLVLKRKCCRFFWRIIEKMR